MRASERDEAMIKHTWHSVVALSLLSGCSTATVINAAGPTSSIATGQYGRFKEDYKISNNNPSDTGDASALLNSGLSLVDNACRDYFRSEGKLQQEVLFTRDAGIAIAPVAAGAMAVSRASAAEIAYATIAGSALTAGVSVVAKDFLFDSNNIDAVERLTMKDMSRQEDKIKENAHQYRSQVDFNWVVNQIEDHQTHCQPAHILSITRKAIGAGKIKAFNSTGGTTHAPTSQDVTDLKKKLAQALGASSITEPQMLALYGLTQKGFSRFSREFATLLVGLGQKSPFNQNGALTHSWRSIEPKVVAAFNSAPASLTAQLIQKLGALETAGSAHPAVVMGIERGFRIQTVPAGQGVIPSQVSTRVVR